MVNKSLPKSGLFAAYNDSELFVFGHHPVLLTGGLPPSIFVTAIDVVDQGLDEEGLGYTAGKMNGLGFHVSAPGSGLMHYTTSHPPRQNH
jgi:hypothetical protein